MAIGERKMKKKPLNRWMLFYVGLVVLGAATLAFHFFVIAQEDRERLILAFVLIVAGCGAIVAGLLGLLVQSIMHLSGAREGPIQPPQTTTGSSAPDRV
jgi:hypothetical protein